MASMDSDYSKIVRHLRISFRAGKIKSLESRVVQLKQLHLLLTENEAVIFDAIQQDLHKHKVETNMCELMSPKIEIGEAINKLHEWMKPKRVKGDLINKLNTLEIRNDPLGVVLIIGAWNFPVWLLVMPLIGALSAGNCAVLKPSELSIKSAALITKLIPKYLDQDCVKVINGGIPETTALLRVRFDHIFYTGSTAVGKIIMRAAAEYLTPVTLELGGKCPTVVDETCNFDSIAQRIVWGKFTNAGQMCLATDYIICIGDIQEKLVKSLKNAIVKFYGEDPKLSESYGRIVNKGHHQRICKLINTDKLVHGGAVDEDALYISPTIMTNVTEDDDIMKDEVFGPLLPILTVSTPEDAVEMINDREKPLGLYVFSNNQTVIDLFANETSSGGMCVNDNLVHVSGSSLPFGGVGYSGMGKYHGKFSFDTFTHKKGYLYKNQRLESLNEIRYPPYDDQSKGLPFVQWILSPTVSH